MLCSMFHVGLEDVGGGNSIDTGMQWKSRTAQAQEEEEEEEAEVLSVDEGAEEVEEEEEPDAADLYSSSSSAWKAVSRSEFAGNLRVLLIDRCIFLRASLETGSWVGH